MIACGGGVVEREENRAMLKEFGRSIGPVIHITREKEEVIRYLIDEKDRPQWGEDMRTGGCTGIYPSCMLLAILTVRASSLSCTHSLESPLPFIRRMLYPYIRLSHRPQFTASSQSTFTSTQRRRKRFHPLRNSDHCIFTNSNAIAQSKKL